MRYKYKKITSFLILSCLLFTVIDYNHLLRFNFLSSDFNKECIKLPSLSSNDDVPVEESWYELWGTSKGEVCRAFAFDPSGNIYLAGITDSYGSGATDFCLVKYNQEGVFQWFQTWGGSVYDFANDIALDSSGNIYLAGDTSSYGAGSTDFCLVKFNNMGVFQWYRTWGGIGWDVGNAIAIDSYNNIYITGETYSYGAGSSDLCLLKYNSSGSLIWSRTWGGIDWDTGNAIAIDLSNNILLGGGTNSYGSGSTDICLVKFDSSGNFISSKYWGGTGQDECSSLAIDILGNIYLAGKTLSYGVGGSDAILLKHNNLTKSFEWYQTWGGIDYEFCNDISLDSFQNLYLAGYTYSFGAGDSDAYIVKFDNSGMQLWNLTWGGLSSESCDAIYVVQSENIYISGATHSFGAGQGDMYLVKYISPPRITINSPESYQIFGNELIEYDLLIIEDNLDTTWYTLDGGLTNYTFSGITGTIDQGAWDSCNEGEVTIRFYVNDTVGNLAFEDIIIIKDTKAPQIFINSPKPNQLCGNSSIDFDLTIIEDNLNETWYTLDGGVSNFTFSGTSGMIDQTAWDLWGNETVTIKFYAEDLTGKCNYSEVIILKDTSFPQINIISPKPNQQFGESSFEFNVTVIDSKINTTWYTLNDGPKFFYNGVTGVIEDVAWHSCGNGTVSIKFYANNTAGNIAYKQVIVRKDWIGPEIFIISPTEYQLLGNTTIVFNLIINDGNLDTTWYTLEDEISESEMYFFSGTSGTIDQEAWDLCGNGLVTISFKGNDTVGNENYMDVDVYKDTESPQIIIESPKPSQLCGNSSIDFDLTIIEENLNTSWYTLNDGEIHYFIGTNGTINQAAWDLCGNGTVSIKFYIKDLLGNEVYEEVVVLKETSFPNITIKSPSQNQLYGNTSIDFDLTIIEENLNTTWYTLNDGEIHFFLGTNGTIDQAAWDLCGNGTVSIKFYANNTSGNTAFEEIIVLKDILSPSISILSPTENQVFGNSTFDFILSIIEDNLYATWYTLDGGLTNYTFSGITGIINHNGWVNKGEGTILLRFYANDSVGNLGYADIIIIKDTTFPLIEIIFPSQFDLFDNLTINFNLTIEELYLQSTWYTLDGGLTNYTFSGTAGTINQVAWDSCPNGTVLIRFYVRDTVGHLSYDEVVVWKDNTKPEINILNPISYQVFGNSTFDFALSIIEGNLNTTWYTLDEGLTNHTFSGTTGTIDQGVWDSCNQGIVHLRFYANDSLGNLAYKDIIILKSFPLTQKRVFAVIVGIANYPGTSNDLMYCGSDATTIQTMLRSEYNIDPANMIVLTNDEATRSAIFNAFAQIDALIGPDDVFIFYYSGHGGEGGGAYHFICPYDSLPSLPTNYIYDIEIDMLLDQVACSRQYVLIDACNSGGFIPEVQASNRFIMTACTADQLSWETSELRHGVFTYYFVDSIFIGTDSNGDGVLSMEEQFSHTSSETISYMLGFGELQQPSNYDGVSGPTVLFPSLGSLSLLPIGNELHFSFNLYGHGLLQCLNITVCSVYKNISLRVIDLRPYSSSNTGFGHYSGTIQLGEGYNISGYELKVEIEGYSLITIVHTFGDTDGDGLYDILEIINGLNPALNDTDSDGISDFDEYYGVTNPLLSDTDGDGMPDGYEVNNGLNPLIDDANLDYDDDGLVNILEFQLGSAANNTDSDNDMMPDLWEYENNLDLLSDDANLDYDNDGLENILEFQLGSAANNADSDNDTMPDLWEYQNNLDLLSNDANLDPDEDGLQNSAEFQNNTDPHLEDTDGDEWSDGDEVDRDTDPTDPDDYPRTSDPSIIGYNLLILIGISCVITTIILKKRTH